MAINDNSVEDMKQYLKYALTFEKYVYMWSGVVNSASTNVNDTVQKVNNYESELNHLNYSLNTLDRAHEAKRKGNDEELAKNKSSVRKTKGFIIGFLIFLGIVGAIIGLVLVNFMGDDIVIPAFVVIPLMVIVTMFVGFLFTGIGPVALVIYFLAKKKVDDSRENGATINEGSRERQRLILSDRRDNVRNLLESGKSTLIVYKGRKSEVEGYLQTAKENLSKIYSINVLPAKYRNFEAVATMYEYLITGRCDRIKGFGGIYSSYEDEKLKIAQLMEMMRMNETMSDIADSQRQICREFATANKTMAEMQNSLKSIEKTSAETAKNTAISAEANKQSAAALSYIAWRMV